MGADAKNMVTATTVVGDGHLATNDTEGLGLEDRATLRCPISWDLVDMSPVKAERAVIPYARATGRDRSSAVDAGEFSISVDGIRSHLCARRSIEQQPHESLAVKTVDCAMSSSRCQGFCSSPGLCICI